MKNVRDSTSTRAFMVGNIVHRRQWRSARRCSFFHQWAAWKIYIGSSLMGLQARKNGTCLSPSWVRNCRIRTFLRVFLCVFLFSHLWPRQQATVLLNGNVGFLAIETVDKGDGVSLRQITSYLSLIASFASIMLGLVLARHNRKESRNSAFAAVRPHLAFRIPCH